MLVISDSYSYYIDLLSLITLFLILYIIYQTKGESMNKAVKIILVIIASLVAAFTALMFCIHFMLKQSPEPIFSAKEITDLCYFAYDGGSLKDIYSEIRDFASDKYSEELQDLIVSQENTHETLQKYESMLIEEVPEPQELLYERGKGYEEYLCTFSFETHIVVVKAVCSMETQKLVSISVQDFAEPM